MTSRGPAAPGDGTALPARNLWLTWIGAALPMIVLPVVIATIPVASASDMGLDRDELAAWFVGLYAIPCLLSLAFAIACRQPLLFTGNVFYIIFIARLAGEIPFREIIGASVVTGVLVLGIVLTGAGERLATLVPTAVVLGLLAGAVLPFVVDLFTLLDDQPMAIGGMGAAYLLGHRYVGRQIPPILPALAAAVVLAPLTGNVGALPDELPLLTVRVFAPAFSTDAILTVVPVLTILILLQSNLPSIVYLRAEGYAPPERPLGITSGIGTAASSLLGPSGISLSLPATSFVAGPQAGPRPMRYMVVVIASVVLLVLVLFAGVAADLPTIVSIDLLYALAGLAVIGVLSHALRAVTSGPLTLGPLCAFAVALSDLSALGLNAFFWALVIGTAVSQTIEREHLARAA